MGTRRSEPAAARRFDAHAEAKNVIVIVRFVAVVLLLAWATLGPARPARAQGEDVVAAARKTAETRRPEALAALELHLASHQRDVDARLLYGLLLSWEARYDESRRELQTVLVQAPAYRDARVALMNVEWWSGHLAAARDAAATILAGDPGNQPARDVRAQADALSRPWSAGISYSHDAFSDGRAPWHETATSIARLTPRGSVILRVSDARRFALGDQLVETEIYPRLRAGTYAFLGVGLSADEILYPANRVAFDLYQSLGGGFEVSGGYRRLAFATATSIYVATMTKYIGNWMLTGKVFHVPGDGSLDSTSYHGGFRRYFGGDGTSYAGLTYSHGFSREEIRNVADLTTLDSDTIRGEIDRQLAGRFRAFTAVGTSRQERQGRPRLWQTSLNAGLLVQF